MHVTLILTMILKFYPDIMVTCLHTKLRLADKIDKKLWLRNTENLVLFHICDLDFDPMTLILKLNLGMVLTYLHVTNEVNRSKGSKLWLRNTKNVIFFSVCDPKLESMI